MAWASINILGRAFLNAGLGYGGSCFPKDLSAFVHIAEALGYEFHLLKEVQKINSSQIERFLKKVHDTLWIVKDKTIGVLGLAFKPNTDDMRLARHWKSSAHCRRKARKFARTTRRQWRRRARFYGYRVL